MGQKGAPAGLPARALRRPSHYRDSWGLGGERQEVGLRSKLPSRGREPLITLEIYNLL